MANPMDSVSFRARIEQVLVKEPRDRDVVVCDNVPVHKVAGISTYRGGRRETDLPAALQSGPQPD